MEWPGLTYHQNPVLRGLKSRVGIEYDEVAADSREGAGPEPLSTGEVIFVRVLIVHFRSAPGRDWVSSKQAVGGDGSDSAGTDGVSLEMVKRRALLEEMGHEVAICSAYVWADYALPRLEFDSDDVMGMMGEMFGTQTTGPASAAGVEAAFRAAVADLKADFGWVFGEFEPEALFVHNILSLPVHPAATVALAEVLRETGLPCTAIHHDILNEGAYKFRPTQAFARRVMDSYYPPAMPNLRHWTINSRNQKSLAERGTDARVIPDTMDFDESIDDRERLRLRSALRGNCGITPQDIVLLVGARIVPNKQIEIAGHLAAILGAQFDEAVGKTLYHGLDFPETGRVILVLAGRPERGFVEYQESLFGLLDELGIAWQYVGNDVRPYRSEEDGIYALFPDMYAIADFVLYPSGWEGFGNQLLEAVAAGLPVAAFEYPVFKEDIAPKGVRVVSLGDTILPERDDSGLVRVPDGVLEGAAERIASILTDAEEYAGLVGHNAAVGREYFGFDVLRAHLRDALAWAAELE